MLASYELLIKGRAQKGIIKTCYQKNTNFEECFRIKMLQRTPYRVLVRAVSYTIHGLIPASCVFADRYNREEVVASLGREINLNPPLTLGQLPDTSEELLKLDQVRMTQLLKVTFVPFFSSSSNKQSLIKIKNQTLKTIRIFLMNFILVCTI